MIEFDGRAARYWKGRYDEDRPMDWQLMRPTKLALVHDSLRAPGDDAALAPPAPAPETNGPLRRRHPPDYLQPDQYAGSRHRNRSDCCNVSGHGPSEAVNHGDALSCQTPGERYHASACACGS